MNHKGTIKRHKDICLECDLPGEIWKLNPKDGHLTRYCLICSEKI
jgi:hypothetical protein